MVCVMGILVYSCEVFEYHPYDTKDFDAFNLNESNIEQIVANDNLSDTLRFVFMGDTQRYYDETHDFVDAVNKLENIDFVIHGGDITDFGMSKEYKWINDAFNTLDVPFVTLIGNHDVLGHGKEIFQYLYGDYNFSFITKGTRFICLNTNALEFDLSTPVPDYEYMQRFIGDTIGTENTIVLMHVPPFSTGFNNNSADFFNSIIEEYKNVRFCLHAHTHKLEENDFFDNGIMYYGCDDISGRSYMVFTVTPDSYYYSVETF